MTLSGRVCRIPLPVAGILVSILVGLLGSSCFYVSLYGQFVFDDSEAIVNNADIKPGAPISNIFRNDFWGQRLTHNASHKSYRPLTVLSFRFNVWLDDGALIPYSFHFFNLILHGIAAALSLPMFLRLFNTNLYSQTPLISSLLFAVHPIHSEAVAGIVGRADLLCAVLCFSSLLVYCRATDSKSKKTTISLTLFASFLAALAMLAKEQGVTILAVCSAYDILIASGVHPVEVLRYCLRALGGRGGGNVTVAANNKVTGWLSKGNKGSNYTSRSNGGTTVLPSAGGGLSMKLILVRHSVLLISGSVLMYTRWWVMGFKTPNFQRVDNPPSFAESILLRALNYNYIYALNAWLLLCPEWLCFDWSMGCVPLLNFENIFTLVDFRFIFVFLFWFSLVTLILRVLKSDSSSTNRFVLMALAFTVVPFSVATNLFFRVGFVIAERVLYLPSVGFCMLVAIGLQKLLQYDKIKWLIYVAFLLLLSVNVYRCYQRSLDWQNEKSLFDSGLKVCPLNAKVHYNLAKTSQNVTVAIGHYRQAIRLHPEYEQAMNNLANILRDKGNITEAEVLLRKAISIRPDFAAAWMNLGIVLSNMKRYDEALQCYRTALVHRKNYPDCYYNLGNLFLSQNKYAEAYTAWRQATTQKPTHSVAWNNMIVMLDSIGNLEEAKRMGLEALSRLPDDPAIHFNLANTLGKQGHYEEAEETFKKAIGLKPNQALYHTNLGVLYHRWKKYELAEEQYLIALKINKDLNNVAQNLKSVQKLSKTKITS